MYPLHPITARTLGHVAMSSEFSGYARKQSGLLEAVHVVTTVFTYLGDVFILPTGTLLSERESGGGQRVEFISVFWEHELIFSATEKLSNNNISLQLTWERGRRSCSAAIKE